MRSPETKQPFDEQAIKSLQYTFTFFVTLNVAFAFAKCIKEIVANSLTSTPSLQGEREVISLASISL